MNIIALSGSMNPASTTKLAVQLVARAVESEGFGVEWIDLRKLALPIYDCRSDESSYPESVHHFREAMNKADGFIIGSPEYHGSISGCLKNALDFIGARELSGKFVALVGTAGGAMGATNTLNTLNIICRTLHAWPLPSMPSIPQSYQAFLPDGTLKDDKLTQRLTELGQMLGKTIQQTKR